MPIPDNVRNLMSVLRAAKHEAYLVGGSVRDCIISQFYKVPWLMPKDYDIFTNASGEDILKLFPQGVVECKTSKQTYTLTFRV